LWRGRADPGAALGVRIAGPAGNPDGVGTRLVLRDEHGMQTRRVRASGGYQASSEPVARFAWRGPARLSVVFPDGQRLEREVAAPGRLELTMP
jgi:hypothetical protein